MGYGTGMLEVELAVLEGEKNAHEIVNSDVWGESLQRSWVGFWWCFLSCSGPCFGGVVRIWCYSFLCVSLNPLQFDVDGHSYNTDGNTGEDVYLMGFPFLSVSDTYYPPFSFSLFLLDISEILFGMSVKSCWVVYLQFLDAWVLQSLLQG